MARIFRTACTCTATEIAPSLSSRNLPVALGLIDSLLLRAHDLGGMAL